jgi:hypothetical protein
MAHKTEIWQKTFFGQISNDSTGNCIGLRDAKKKFWFCGGREDI